MGACFDLLQSPGGEHAVLRSASGLPSSVSGAVVVGTTAAVLPTNPVTGTSTGAATTSAAPAHLDASTGERPAGLSDRPSNHVLVDRIGANVVQKLLEEPKAEAKESPVA